ncbi:MAG: hypothetical protein J6X88_02190 [Bacteroidales bacterium]|nr:hypothetical protein [Bacteroidales bacterium]
MKKIILSLFLMVAALGASAQTQATEEPVRNLQFSLPIWPEKVWPSEYANYNNDVHNCCEWLLNAAAGYNAPKREECTNFLLRWLEGSPEVRVYLVDGLVDVNNPDLLIAYIAAWTRHELDNPEDSPLICANVAVDEMLKYYDENSQVIGKSKLVKKLLKLRSQSKLAPYVKQCLLGK